MTCALPCHYQSNGGTAAGEKERVGQEEYAENIRHASDYMLSLVDTLMNFYLLDTGQARENISVFCLETLFREITNNYMPLVQKKGLQLLTQYSGMNAVVSCDKGHLQQIVNNLLSNALKFTGKGYVRLEATFNVGELCIKVQDTGAGMNDEEQKRIFNAFERLDNAVVFPVSDWPCHCFPACFTTGRFHRGGESPEERQLFYRISAPFPCRQ